MTDCMCDDPDSPHCVDANSVSKANRDSAVAAVARLPIPRNVSDTFARNVPLASVMEDDDINAISWRKSNLFYCTIRKRIIKKEIKLRQKSLRMSNPVKRVR